MDHPDPCWKCTVGVMLTRRWLFRYRLAFLWARIIDGKERE